MGPSGQYQHFTDLKQKVCSSIHDLGLQRGLPSLDGKLERFATKKRKITGASIRIIHSCPDYHWCHIRIAPFMLRLSLATSGVNPTTLGLPQVVYFLTRHFFQMNLDIFPKNIIFIYD